MASPDLIWQCVRDSSSFLVKRKNREVMTKEPGNITGINSFKFSGLIGTTFDVCADVKKLEKRRDNEPQIFRERVYLVKSSKKAKSKLSPRKQMYKARVALNKKQGLEKIQKASVGSFYRSDLCELAQEKYLKICRSFQKRARTAPTSRRNNKN